MKINTLQTKFNAVLLSFVALISISVGATFIVAETQEGDAQIIDLAAGQRLLITQIKETAQRLITALESESDSAELTESLAAQAQSYNRGLNALTGGAGADGGMENSFPAPSEVVGLALDQVDSRWQKYRAALQILLAPDADVTSDAFYDASVFIADAHEALAQATSTVIPLLKGESESKIKLLKNILGLAMVATLLVSLLAWLFVRTKIIRPITDLADGINTMSNESDLTQRVNVKSGDEVGQVSAHFNAMAEKFQTIVSELSAAVIGIDREAEMLATITSRTRDDVEQQHLRLESVATSMNEMSASAQSIVENTEAAAETTTRTVDEAERGQSAVNDSSRVLQNMVEAIQRTADQMASLEKDAEGIGAIVDVIRSIAEQTNLLALNAAIEAARAGEQGRGFAVVADEVRSLAERTQKSTGEIQDMIGQLQSNTEKAAAFMHEGQAQAEKSTSNTKQIFAALEQMNLSVEDIKGLNAGIATAAQQQSRVTEEISRSVMEISGAVGTTTSNAEQTADTGTNLTSLSTELRQTVERFKI